MNFEEWLSLSDDERDRIQQTWNPYGDGYWPHLLASAEERFRQEFGHAPHVVGITSGVYHGGTLIIGVTLDLPLAVRSEQIPSRYLGFHVQQFWSPQRGKNAEPSGAANRGQPVRSNTNRASPAAGPGG